MNPIKKSNKLFTNNKKLSTNLTLEDIENVEIPIDSKFEPIDSLTFNDVDNIEVLKEDENEIMEDKIMDKAFKMLNKEDREKFKKINTILKQLPPLQRLKDILFEEITLEIIEKNKHSEGTAVYYTYVLNVYMNYFNVQLLQDNNFNSSVPFPLRLSIIKHYAFYLRMTEHYAYSTTVRLSFWALKVINFKYCNDNLSSLNKKVKEFFIRLAYSIGSKTYKIRPLLNKRKDKILQLIDQSNYFECLLNLLIMQKRSKNLRGNTLSVIKLKDIIFIRSKVNGCVILSTRFWLEKDKIILKKKDIRHY